VELVTSEAEAQPEKPGSLAPSEAGDPDERLAEIRARSAQRYEWDKILSLDDSYYDSCYDSDTRWLLRYVDMLREDNKQLRKRRTSFEHKVFTIATLLVGLAVVGVIGYDLYLQPAYEIVHAWVYDPTGHLP
jgi:hypothetical protein